MLQLKRSAARISVTGIGASKNGCTRGSVSLILSPWYKDEPQWQVEAYVFQKLTTKQCPIVQYIDVNYFNQFELADPHFYKGAEIDIILGADIFFELLCDGKSTTVNNLHMQKTLLGWVIAGPSKGVKSSQVLTVAINQPEENLDGLLRKFWEIEEVKITKPNLTEEEDFCERHFEKNSKRDNTGRFEVSLPFKKAPSSLGNSFRTAVKRMYAIERKFERNHEFESMYKSFMSEYIELGHMKLTSNNSRETDNYYLPHHGVMKGSSNTTRLRVVFDGSAKTDLGNSLNDCLAVGPTVQSSLYDILSRFRKYKVAFTADVEKMFRQVLVAQNDTQYQQILWRNSPNEHFGTYKLQTVTYGTACATYLATRALNETTEAFREEFPEAVSHIKNNIYVDDLMTGADTRENAIKLRDEITMILSSHGFKLRKWMSNEKAILTKPVEAASNPLNILEIEESDSVKVLGLCWNPKKDCFQFKVKLNDQPIVTKRGILSEASRLFDPLGWLAPVTIKIKTFFQALWMKNLEWDDELPPDLASEWLKIRNSLMTLEEIEIERYLGIDAVGTTELHGFSDASEQAYSAVVYGKTTMTDGSTVIKLLSSKTKVAPLKQISIPRLELCGALLLTRLLETVKQSLQINISKITAWTDSTIVLDWLSAHPTKWTTFVGNRTGEILSSMNRTQWRHVESQNNPADCASRGIDPAKLQVLTLWWNGPKWLADERTWPISPKNHLNTREEMRCHSLHAHVPQHNIINELIEKNSSFNKAVKILAYVLRYIKLKLKQTVLSNIPKTLQSFELSEARRIIFRYVQHQHFQPEIKLISTNKEVPNSSKLKQLRPFLDGAGLLRVGGRIMNASITYDIKHPLILPAKDKLTETIVRELHLKYLHAGPTLLTAALRQRYWIIGNRRLVRQVVHNCIRCVKYKAKRLSQVMGELPNSRVELVRPFHKVGVDYAGPFLTHLTKGRGQKTYKSYICIFVCLATKATHIELVSELSTDAYIAGLRRFIGRRGIPKEIHSDNGTNFIGARNHLSEFFKFLRQNADIVSNFLLTDEIAFKFIPPYAPHFGGLWESAVKSIKHHLRRVTNGHTLITEELTTLLIEIEAMLNSRLICLLSSDEMDYLTPGHFLIGRPTTQLPSENLQEVKLSKLSRWQIIQKMNQHIWSRWSTEYLTNLQTRSKWHKTQSNIKIGDVVLIADNNLPTSKWLLGKVLEVHPGVDGNTRVVTLKSKQGTIQRPIHKLCLLPVS